MKQRSPIASQMLPPGSERNLGDPVRMHVEQRPAAAAFFDLDDMLIRGAASTPFAVAAFRRGLVSKRELLAALKNQVPFLPGGSTDQRSAEVRGRMSAAPEVLRSGEVTALSEFLVDYLVEEMQPELAELLAMHLARGEARVLLSASPTEIVSALADRLGLELGNSTTAARLNGGHPGTLAGPFCGGGEKVQIVTSLAAEHGWDLARCSAYSNSVSDLPLLEIVGNPVVVSPDQALRETARERGWPVIETGFWRSLRGRDLSGAAWRSVSGLPVNVWCGVRGRAGLMA